jgi:NAD(P)-dependent dehydrogenase (short-subunit alcohol dehydrogenase family)
MTDRLNLEGHVAVVTGSGQGIGRAIAHKLAARGARVVINDVVGDRVEKSAADLRAEGFDVVAISGDITRQAFVEQLFAESAERFGSVDILVNNVGVGKGPKGFDLTVEGWNEILELNLTHQYACSRSAFAFMKEKGWGRIINISSSAGRFRSSYIIAGGIAYSAAKAGVLGLTRQMAYEVAGTGILVNAVVPGNIETEEGKKDLAALPEDIRSRILHETMLRRFGSPNEVAGAVAFLASDAASYVTGASLIVNGGWGVA